MMKLAELCFLLFLGAGFSIVILNWLMGCSRIEPHMCLFIEKLW
jgi:hypothetical protein